MTRQRRFTLTVVKVGKQWQCKVSVWFVGEEASPTISATLPTRQEAFNYAKGVFETLDGPA